MANASQISSDFIRQHFFQSEAEEVWGIAAVRPGGDVAAYACRPSRASMAQRTAVGQTSTNRIIDVEIACAVAFIRALSLHTSKLALEKLASATNRTKWITIDDEK
jgi:hypothetical protein